MRQSFRRAGLLVAAVLLAFAGAITFAAPASAVKLQNELSSDAVTRACTGSSCASDVMTIQAGTRVDTYCVHGNFNVTYTGSATGRGGFIDISRFTNPGLQFTPCNDAGIFGQVSRAGSTTLRSCSGTCVNFGSVAAQTSLRAFCELSDAPNRWFLVFVDTTGRAGFVSETALSVIPGVPSCNSPF